MNLEKTKEELEEIYKNYSSYPITITAHDAAAKLVRNLRVYGNIEKIFVVNRRAKESVNGFLKKDFKEGWRKEYEKNILENEKSYLKTKKRLEEQHEDDLLFLKSGKRKIKLEQKHHYSYYTGMFHESYNQTLYVAVFLTKKQREVCIKEKLADKLYKKIPYLINGATIPNTQYYYGSSSSTGIFKT